MAQGADIAPTIYVNDHELDVVSDFTYLGSTVRDDLSLDSEISRRIGRASTTFGRLSKRAWGNSKLTLKTKMAIYRACVLSALLYASESWTLYARQERKLNNFHMRCLRRILNIRWSDKITNNEVLARAGLPSLFSLLRQRRLRWLGHVARMSDGRIPKDLLYGELASGTRARGRPHLRFKDACKQDMIAFGIDINNWEDVAAERGKWRAELAQGLRTGEAKLKQVAEDKRTRRKLMQQGDPSLQTVFRCTRCDKDCHSRVGLFSHTRKCMHL